MKLNKMKQINKKNKGFTLLELILVLGIGSLAFIGFIQMEVKRQENLSAENAGGQIDEVGRALAQYINMNNSVLQSAIPSGITAPIILSAMQSSTGNSVINGVNVPNRLLLPTTYVNRLVFPTVTPITYTLTIKNNAGNLTGLLITNSGIIDKTGAIRYDWAGIAMKKAGSNAGVSFGNPGEINGLNGFWTLRTSDFADINALGKLGYRVAYQGTYDSAYLRLDGLYPMNGHLNMGNYNIKNATDISYTGWLYGNNAVMNNLLTGTITNAGNITTQSINGKNTKLTAATAANGALNYGGNYSYANFELLYTNCINCGVSGDYGGSGNLPFDYREANGDVRIGSQGKSGNLFVKDIMLGNNSSANSYLSDRLPRYVDKGIQIKVDDGFNPGFVIKPSVVISNNYTPIPPSDNTCRWTGIGNPPIPKIEVVPALQWSQGAVLGDIVMDFNGSNLDSNNQLHLFANIYQNQYTLGANQTYAVDGGNVWYVYSRTPNYNGSTAYTGGTVLAHVYCDYGIPQ